MAYEDADGEAAFREHVNDFIIENWVSQLLPELAVHRKQLIEIACQQVLAKHAEGLLTQRVMTHILMRELGREFNPEEVARYQKNLDAIRVFLGLEPPSGPTGIEAFDDMTQLCEKLLSTASDTDVGVMLVNAVDEARQVGDEMYLTLLAAD